MKLVHRLWHIHEMLEYEEEGNLKTLGIYTSLSKINESIVEYSKLPGFRNQRKIFFVDDDYKAGFLIGQHTIGHSGWQTGYITVGEIMSSLYGTVITEDEEENINFIIDIPYWAREKQPKQAESAVDFATRLIQEKYGNMLYPQGPQSEFFQIKKLYEVNNFNIPKSASTQKARCNSSSVEIFSDSKDAEGTSFVYLVHHLNPKNDDGKQIGIYSSLREAETIVEQYKSLKGFEDSTEGFYIAPYELNKMYWAEGYYSVKVKNKQG